jgi:enamine deaminase RidA (YjgF/YER057c/UK114 family)
MSLAKKLIYPLGPAAPRGAYSPGIKVELPGGGSMLYVTGQLARAPDGSVVAPFDVTAQTEYIFRLLGEILAAAEMGYDDVVRAQTYLTDMADFPKFSAVRDRYFGDAKPASTLIEVKGLAHNGCCVEVEITAMK